MKKLLTEFRAFIMKGNVLDLATAVIVGAAFNKIVTSLVTDIIMPPIGFLLGRMEFKDLKYVMQPGVEAVLDDKGEVLVAAVAEVSIKYGLFIQTILDFVIIGFCIFMIIKIYQRLERKKAEEEPTPEPTKSEELLTEIRDLLKK